MRSPFVRWRIAAAVGVLGSLAGVVSAESSARAAEDSASPRRLPAPFVLPELSHPTLDARVDWLVGRVSPVAAHRSAAAAALLVPSVETSAIAFHRVSFGFTLPIAAALPPDGALARFLSLFPFTAPLLMFMRISVQPPPAWEIALSIAILLLTIWGVAWFAGRVYRVGILMYGKKPTFPEIIRWAKAAD